jgi:N-acetylglucosaminyldiphosphoundecaprenol N-acetyl-beta-D-mannosaminyltransferase
MLQESEPLRKVYATADLVTADGMPVVVASRWLGHPLPERVTGADLVPALFASGDSTQPIRVFLLGAAPGVADRAARQIEAQWPGVRVVGTCSPPMGFEKDPGENRHILAEIAAVHPDILVVGLGAPKQEFWVHAHRDRIAAKVALCVGATIDFLAGEKPRAPSWMGKLGIEWLHRLCSEPKRLFRRYAHDAYVFPQLVWREWRAGHSRRVGA